MMITVHQIHVKNYLSAKIYCWRSTVDQYIKVIFPTRRKVWVDGNEAGLTNKVFRVETGHHTITLGQSKKNYTPERQDVILTGTTPTESLIIIFIRKDS